MSKARQAAAAVVHAVIEYGESLDTALEQHGTSLPTNETALYREIAYGGVRWCLAYQAYLDTQLKKPFKPKDSIVNAILITALYQLDYTEQAPHAVVHEAVSLASKFRRKWAAGVINAVLRAYLRNRAEQPLTNQKSWLEQSFPSWLYAQISVAWPEYVDQILASSQAKPPMTLRVNTQRQSREAYLKLLSNADIAATPCEDSKTGIQLLAPLTVHKLPGFDAGWVSIQDEAAQLAAPLMDLAPGQRVLDACAAPGGKSMHILEHESALKQLTVLDFAERMPRLRENVNRAGVTANIIEGDLLTPESWWDGVLFDRILLDVPCTGTGVIRRHPDIKLRRREQNVLQFAAHQHQLLSSALDMLKPGGKLLYTTCSILAAENELCVAQFVAQKPSVCALDLPDKTGIRTAHGCQRLPGVHQGDGFFYALLQKI